MNDDVRDDDLGDPIAELRALDLRPPDGFVPRVRNAIQRRLFTGQVIDFGLRPLGEFLMEYVVMFTELFAGGSRPAPRTKQGSDDE